MYTPYGWQDAPDGWEIGDAIPDGFEDSEINATNLEAFGEHILDQAGTDAPDADASTKGLIQLTGDLTGTAGSPAIADGAVDAAAIAASLKPTGSASAGTEALRALGTTGSTAAAGNDARLSDARTPSDGSVTAAKVANSLKPSGTAATTDEALRALGTASGTAAAGNDSRLSDSRTPTDGSVTAAKVAGSLKPSGTAAAGDEALRALGTTSTTAAAGNDSRLSDTRTPSDGSVTLAKVNTALKPSGSAATTDEALRAIGTTGATACAGNDSRLSNTRTPTDATVTLAKLASDALAHLKAVVVDTGSGYGSRPSGFASVEFVGPDDPDSLAEDGDTWIPTEAP